MKFGISTFVTDDGIDPVSLARAIEERDFASLVIAEHTHIPASRESAYPMGGELPSIYYKTLDPFVTLAAAAAVTSKIELFTGIALLIQRDPITTAKEAASIDLISGGRFVFGVGAGWNIEELRDHGTDPKTRGALLDERIEAIKALWTADPAEYHGKYVDFDPSFSRPKPVQKPHPPIYIGGDSDATVKRVIRHDAGWISNPLPGGASEQAHRPDPRWRGPRRAAGAVRHPRGPRLLARRRGSGLWAGGNTPAHQAARRIAQASRRIRRIGGSLPRLTPCGSTVFSGHRLNSIPPRQPFRSGGRRLPLGEQNATSPSLFADPAGPRLVADSFVSRHRLGLPNRHRIGDPTQLVLILHHQSKNVIPQLSRPVVVEQALATQPGSRQVDRNDLLDRSRRGGHDGDPIRKKHRLVDIVGHEQRRGVRLGHDEGQLLLQTQPGECIQRAERLVHQQQGWPLTRARAKPTRCFMPPES